MEPLRSPTPRRLRPARCRSPARRDRPRFTVAQAQVPPAADSLGGGCVGDVRADRGHGSCSEHEDQQRSHQRPSAHAGHPDEDARPRGRRQSGRSPQGRGEYPGAGGATSAALACVFSVRMARLSPVLVLAAVGALAAPASGIGGAHRAPSPRRRAPIPYERIAGVPQPDLTRPRHLGAREGLRAGARGHVGARRRLPERRQGQRRGRQGAPVRTGAAGSSCRSTTASRACATRPGPAIPIHHPRRRRGRGVGPRAHRSPSRRPSAGSRCSATPPARTSSPTWR